MSENFRFRKRGKLRANSKSEQIVLLRQRGLAFPDIAAIVGTTAVSARVLYWKRKNLTQRLLANGPDLDLGE